MIDAVPALTGRALDAVADLERRVVAADGGRLKLEWGVLRSRTGSEPSDLLWWEGDRLAGFAGLYGFGPPDVEIAGMVDPQYRRRGIASALLDAALPLCRSGGYRRALLVTPRNDAGGREFAARRGAPLEHSEYALVQQTPPPPAPDDPSVSLRTAVDTDIPILRRLFTAGFGDAPQDLEERTLREADRTVMIEQDGTVVGTLRAQLDGSVGGIYGFTVDPDRQGRGIGREALRRTCARFWADGATAVRLEVAVDNPRALHLYTSLGFAPVSTEDYYAVDL